MLNQENGKIFENDVFYSNKKELQFNDRKALLQDAYNVATEWWVDILDCNKSYSRQRIEMSFEEIMKKFDNGSHFVVIERKGYNTPYYGEIGFRTMHSPDYFLFIHTTSEELHKIVDKYKLQ